MRALLLNIGHAPLRLDRHPRHHVAPVELGIAAAILERAGWEVELIDSSLAPDESRGQFKARVSPDRADVLLVRILPGSEETALDFLHECGAPGVLRLALGAAANELRDRLLAKESGGALVDGVLRGEPEGTLLDLLPHLREGELPRRLDGLQRSVGLPTSPRFLDIELDELPMPAHRHLVGKGYRFWYPLDVEAPLEMGYVLSSRGCAMRCIFCAPLERDSLGTQYRARSAENVVEEIRELRRLGANAVYFVDDFFGFSVPRIHELCEAMLQKDVVLPWAAQVRAQGLDDATLALMRRAGCSTLCYGAESASDRLLRLLKKGVTSQQVRAQAGRIRRAGIQSVAYFMVGIPTETESERHATYRFIEELQPDVAQLHVFNVVPGSPAWEEYASLYDPEGSKFSGAGRRKLEEECRRVSRRYHLSLGYVSRSLRRRWQPMWVNRKQSAEMVKDALSYMFALR